MPITKVIQGDLVKLAKEGEFDVIVHGCNCLGRMGAGIAPQIANAFPGVREADLAFEIPVGDVNRLGQFSHYEADEVAIVNAYTQFTFKGREQGNPDISYQAVRDVFTSLNKHLTGIHIIGIPYIGAGLAGGHWEAIQVIIDEVTPELNITLVEYSHD